MDKCERYIDVDDENLLLDDEKKYGEGHKQVKWMNGDTGPNINWSQAQKMNGCFLNDESESIMLTVIDEYATHLEDAPLLINDCYKTSEENGFHCHDFTVQRKDSAAWKKLLSVLILCCVFMIIELLGGYISGSLAIMTDAAHLLSDCIGFFISLLSIRISSKSPTKNMTFGYHRIEVLGAVLSVSIIWILAAVFCFMAIQRIYQGNYNIDVDCMVLISCIGILINIIMAAILHGICHTHSHGHQNESSKKNMNVRAAAAHILGDILQSAGVLTAALIIKYHPNAEIADPICTLIFSVIVIITTLKIGKDSLWIIAEGSPLSSAKLNSELKNIAEIEHIHNIHVWSLAPGKNIVTAHVAVGQYCDRDLLLKQATSVICKQINVVSCTVQIEAYNPQMTNSCEKCKSFKC